MREVLEPGLAATGPESEEALGGRASARRAGRRSSAPGRRSASGGSSSTCCGRTDAGTPSEDPNQRAVVLVASYGEADVFLSADAESDVTSRLPLGAVEIMKVAHHGSEDAGLADELRDAPPACRGDLVRRGTTTTAIRAPRPSRRSRARRASRVYRTDLDGRVVVESDGRNLTVRSDR